MYRPFKCHKCKKDYQTKAHLKHHLRNAHNQKRDFPCPICGKRFKDAGGVRDHKKMMHNPSRATFPCGICGKPLMTKVSRRLHEKRHLETTIWKCEICHKSYKSSSGVNSHMKSAHTNWQELPFECIFCKIRFPFLTPLHIHLRVHIKERPYLCPECPRELSTSSELKEHRKTHEWIDGMPYQCSTCGKKFTMKYSLKLHEALHSGDRPFPCEFCENRFVSRPQLFQHLRIHLGEKVFQCKFCGKSFSNPVSRDFHQKKKKNRCVSATENKED